MKDMILGKSITIPFAKGAKTVEVFDLESEIFTYSKQKGSGECSYSLTVFCPKCSDTHEYNSKGHVWKSKWIIEDKDYSFQVVYSEDEDGETFAKCSKCDFDLRDEYIYGSVDEKPTPVGDLHQVSITGVSYADGCFVMPLDSFKKAIMEGYKRKATLFATVGSMSYKIHWQAYSNPDNIVSKDGKVFLRKNVWKQA